jgi:hypothetical protein
MSPSAALASPIFHFYLSFTAGAMITAGALLALLRWTRGQDVERAWKSYRGWLFMIPLLLGTIFLGRGVTIVFFTTVAIFGFKEFSRATGLYQDWLMTGAVYLGIAAAGILSLVKDPSRSRLLDASEADQSGLPTKACASSWTAGRMTRKQVPWPATLSTSMRPP